jgi:hypothetical protein
VRAYVEVSSNGIDESLAGISGSPFGSPTPTYAGLRIPNAALSQRYLFLLASRTISKPTRIRGIRQMLTIGADLPRPSLDGEPEPVTNPVELNVTTPGFKFLDGNVSWHLVREPNARHRGSVATVMTDATSFRFIDSDGPALLYQTFTAAAGTTNPATGAPLFYPTALTAYTPPAVWGEWQPIAGDLGNFNDIRFKWDASPAWEVDIPVPVLAGAQRVSLYASVLQTSAAAMTIPNYPNPLPTGFMAPPEVHFIMTNFNLSPSVTTRYWRIGGALVFEDAEWAANETPELVKEDGGAR